MILKNIFRFFKKKKPEQETPEQINFKEIPNYINKKKEKIKNNQEEPQKQIRENLSELLQELEKNTLVLKNIDLEGKKAPEAAKLIVRENFSNFIYYLEKLISDLKELDSESLETLISKINSIFSEFEKKSLTSFQKSTFLIGDELKAVADNIKKFFKSFNKIIKENNPSIEQKNKISIIEKKLTEFNDLEKIESENNKSIENIENKTKDFENRIQELKKEIENMKKTQKYIEQIKNKQELETAKIKLVIELQTLKEMIDFKALAKVYHSIEEQMNIIKIYKDNFKQGFEKYGSEKLLELIDIKAINQEPIKEKIKTINTIKQNINNIKIEKDPTKELKDEINHVKQKIGELNIEKLSIERRCKRLQEDESKIKNEVVEEFKGLNVVVRG